MAWDINDISWNDFNLDQVEPEVLAVLKTAALVEFNSPDYVTYLKQVFCAQTECFSALEQWGRDERQHGEALKVWVERADPSFDFDSALEKFRSVYRVPLSDQGSVRGSITGEMLSRCIVESATSFFYTSIKDRTSEPCLRQLCRYIARDEFEHYQMFLRIMNEQGGRPSWFKLSKVALQRIREVEDAELASAFWASSGDDRAFDLAYYSKRYNQLSLGLFEKEHVYRLSSMIARPLGIAPWGRVMSMVNPIVWKCWAWNLNRLERAISRQPSQL